MIYLGLMRGFICFARIRDKCIVFSKTKGREYLHKGINLIQDNGISRNLYNNIRN